MALTSASSSLQRRTLEPTNGCAHRIIHDFDDLCK
jgi:hypothetical protein